MPVKGVIKPTGTIAQAGGGATAGGAGGQVAGNFAGQVTSVPAMQARKCGVEHKRGCYSEQFEAEFVHNCNCIHTIPVCLCVLDPPVAGQPPPPGEHWQSSVRQDVRDHLIKKM